jgi:hypothetical protein
MTNQALIEDIIIRDANPPMLPEPYQKWLALLTESELDDYHQCIKAAHPATMGRSFHA